MATKDDGKLTRKEFIGRASASLAVLGSLGWGGSPLFGWEAPQAKPPAGDPAGPAAGPGDPSARHSGKKAPALRLLGRTGLKVTPIGFGASRTMEPSLVKAALDRGINFFDTGRSYFNGRNEVMLGKALQGRRDEVVIQSKIPLRLRRKEGEPLSPEALKRVAKSLRASLDASLKALATDRVEVMLLHGISSPSVLENETVWDFFREARKKGMIRACGFSTHANQAAMLRSANKDAFFDVVMVTYNHKGSFRHSRSGAFRAWDQKALEKELATAAKKKIGVVAMKTCSGGPYSPVPEEEPSFRAAVEWVLKHDFIAAAAVAMANVEEIEEDCKCLS